MQKVTPIMPPRSGVHHPRSINAMPTDTARRDLFAPNPTDTGSTAGPRATAEAETAAGVNVARKKKAPSLRQGGVTYGAPSAILIGEAGANLVLSKLQGWGIPTQVAMPGIAYDLIADIPGVDLLRIQVKTRSTAKGNSCAFNLTRGFYYSKAGIFNYGRDDFDLAAFVCLSIGAVFFCHDPKDYISVRRAWMQSSTIARDSFDLALQAIQQRRLKDQLSWLASMDDSAPAPHLTPDFAPHPVPCSAPHPAPSVPASASVPAPTHVPVRAPKRVPLVVARREPPPIPPAIDVLDAVDWDEAEAMFSDDGLSAIIPI
jgi:hypothetical protein